MYTLSNPPQLDWLMSPPPPARPPRRRSLPVEILKFLGLFAFFFALLVLIVMGPTYYTQISYLWQKPSNNLSKKYDLPASVADSAQDITALNDLFNQKQALFAEDTVVIPQIGVDAPIIYLDTADNDKIIAAIQNGIGHYLGTAMPGRNGNVFLTGHSSYYWWSGGKYNQVFARLEYLKAGDLVYIYYQGGKYIYRITNSFVVRPEQVEVLQPTVSPTLTLMTCVPVGTNLRRLIVQAELIGQPAVSGGDFGNITLPKPPTILPLY